MASKGEISEDADTVERSVESEPSRHKPTEKYVVYQSDIRERFVKSAITSWRRRARQIQSLLADCKDASVLRKERDLINESMSNLSDAFANFLDISPSAESSPLGEQYSEIEKEHTKIVREIKETICAVDIDKTSVISGQSKVSNMSIKAVLASEAAALKAKLSFMDLEAAKRVELEKMKRDLNRLQVVRDLNVTEAKIQAIANIEEEEEAVFAERPPADEDINFVDRFVESTVEQTRPLQQGTSIEHIQPFIENTVEQPQPPQQQNSFERMHQESDMSNLIKCLSEQILISRLPTPEPDVFYGDPLKFANWKTAFETLIQNRGIPPSERLYYLKKYLRGEAKDAIEGYFVLANDDAYTEAKKLLEKRYGDPFTIANAFRKKLDTWPKLSPRDGSGLRKLADFLRQCDTAIDSLGCLSVLNDEKEIQKILSKLPDWIINRWCRRVVKLKETNSRFPPFKDFVKFMEQESDIANDPIMSLQAIKGTERNTWNQDKHTKDNKRHVFATTRKEVTMPPSTKQCCIVCEKTHFVDDCTVFLAKNMQEKRDIALKRGLCFGCLQQGHLSKNCEQRLTCKTCSKLHPTSFHGDVRKLRRDQLQLPDRSLQSSLAESVNTSVSHLIDIGGSSKCSMILPVYVGHRDNPFIEVLVYALLDTQSDTTFISTKTCEALGVKGQTVNLTLSTMSLDNAVVKSERISGFSVRSFSSNVKVSLPSTYTREKIPANKAHLPTPDVARRWPHLTRIASELLPEQDIDIGLLIGYNCSQALSPKEIITRDENEPFAQRTVLGWGIIGIVDPDQTLNHDSDPDAIGYSHSLVTIRVPNSKVVEPNEAVASKTLHISLPTRVKETVLPIDVCKSLELDFAENEMPDKMLSQDDKQFLMKMNEGIHQTSDGHFEMPLPLKDLHMSMSSNKAQANRRLNQLRKRFQNDSSYYNDYKKFMDNIIEQGFAERVCEEINKDENTWYIPHHGVYHPQKKKIRVVFDCSARYQGMSLNDCLLQVPDLTNTLVGVLCRFRQEPIAFICDIEQMFYQFKVNREHRNYLRFLWWKDGNFETLPDEYRMNVHLFGASSSPGCANFGLRHAADEFEHICGTDAANFVRRNFYVDDGLGSVPSVEEAVSLIQSVKELCHKGGLRLHKFVSNSKEVLSSVSPKDRAPDLQNIDLISGTLPMERALGIQWCVESDAFRFRLTLKDQPLSRRGILSSVCSIYDPLGFLAPVVLVAKQILQEMTRDGLSWDADLPENLCARWQRWRQEIFHLDSVFVPRCFKPPCDPFQKLSAELHHFSDASILGYGQVTYLRYTDSDENIHCSFVMGKSRVTPLKLVTIPRLELTAALLSVKISSLLSRELDFIPTREIFWTDSRIVLGYINNESRRFRVFVANRVEQIRAATLPKQWNYISSKENPADAASRGLSPDELVHKSTWLQGPAFLWSKDIPVCELSEDDLNLPADDPEVKTATSFSVHTSNVPVEFDEDRFNYFSDYFRLQRAIANCLKLQKKFKYEKQKVDCKPLSVESLQEAEHEILRIVQKCCFKEEIEILSKNRESSDELCKSVRLKTLKRSSPLYKLNPFLDDQGILRVGGRLQRGSLPFREKHPAILPKKHHVTNLIVRHFHEKAAHQGRGMTVNAIREHGFWILGCSSVVYQFIAQCVTCRKLRSKTHEQIMSDLPVDRLTTEAPFTYCGLDCFGPWYITEGRKQLKRYGVLFTCLSSRAVHLETVNTMTTDSFISCLRRFICLRGPVKQIRCDRGTNFVGAQRELKEAMLEMDTGEIFKTLLKENCNFMMNVPTSSHMGGVWERQIKTVRRVLESLLTQSGQQLDDEGLRTFMCEASAIVNSRPLTTDNLYDPMSLRPLTPNQLLTFKSRVVLPPPGNFEYEGVYARKRWRRVQHLADEFWQRWKREYLHNLQPRQKWIKSGRDLQVNDIVIVKDDSMPRCLWQLGRIVEVFKDDDKHVRKVRLVMSDRNLDSRGRRVDSKTELERPVQKLVVLLEN